MLTQTNMDTTSKISVLMRFENIDDNGRVLVDLVIPLYYWLSLHLQYSEWLHPCFVFGVLGVDAFLLPYVSSTKQNKTAIEKHAL